MPYAPHWFSSAVTSRRSTRHVWITECPTTRWHGPGGRRSLQQTSKVRVGLGVAERLFYIVVRYIGNGYTRIAGNDLGGEGFGKEHLF